MSDVNPDFITAEPVSKTGMKQQLQIIKDELEALMSATLIELPITIADVTDLQTTLDAMQAEIDALDGVVAGLSEDLGTLAIADVSGLQAALDAKVAGPLSFRPYVYVNGVSEDAEEYMRVLPPACSFPSGGAGSDARAAVAATGSTTYTAKKNGTGFCTWVFAAAGTVATVTLTSTTTFNGSSDVLTLEGPATADATLSGIGILLNGTLT